MQLYMYDCKAPTAKAVVVAENVHQAMTILRQSGAADWGPFSVMEQTALKVPPQRPGLVRLAYGFKPPRMRKPKWGYNEA